MLTVSPSRAVASDQRLTRLVERTAWIFVSLVAAIHAWLYRYEVGNLDGISYLELAWAWRDGRWADAMNGYWSPGYPWLIAAALRLVNPGPYWEYPLVHAVNFVATLIALAGFTYLVRGLTARWDDTVVPKPAFVAAAYALFLWTALVPLVAWMESPDMFLATFIYLAFGALVRLTSGASPVRSGVVLGLALAAGYLTKAAMMPIAGAFFAAALLATRWRTAIVAIAAAALSFLVLAGPWVTALSAAKGRPTFGDAGRLNYMWFVNRSENWAQNWPRHWPHWEGGPENGLPASSARRLLDDPAVYEFATAAPSTYPMWYDPSAWYDGLRANFNVRDQARRILISVNDVYRVLAVSPYNFDFFNPQPAIAAVLVLMVLLLRALGERGVFRSPIALWLPSTGAIALYMLVYVEQRYIAAFLAMIWLLALDGLRRASGVTAGQVLRCGAVTMTAVLLAAVAVATVIEAYGPARRALRGEPDKEHLHWARAERMLQAGLHPGDTLGYIGRAQVATPWAHLARVRIVAEVPALDAPKVSTDPTVQEQVVAAFRKAGARWAIWNHPDGEPPPHWQRVDRTPYLIRRLN